MNSLETHVETLAAKAAASEHGPEAMHFAQAAFNLAQAAITIATMKRAT